MRRWMWIGALILVILGGIAIGVSAYNAGVSHGLEQTGRAVEVVRVVGHGYFPFGLFLFPLFFIGLILLIRGAFGRRRWGGPGPGDSGPGHWGPGGWSNRQAMFEDWHRRQHEQGTGDHPGSGGEPASA